jgi:hypothetical protein
MDVQTPPNVSTVDRAGWSVERFAEAAGVSRAMLYALPDNLQPDFVKVGRRRIITEAPTSWLARLRTHQQRKAAAVSA